MYRDEPVDPGLKNEVMETDGSWLPKEKAISNWVMSNKLITGAFAFTAYKAYKWATQETLSNSDPTAPAAPGTCGTTVGNRKGINPKKWGPPAWDFLHSVTVDYPEKPNPKQREAAKKLVQSWNTCCLATIVVIISHRIRK